MKLGKETRYRLVATTLVAAVLVWTATVPVSACSGEEVGPTKDFVTEDDIEWDGDERIGDGHDGLHGVDEDKGNDDPGSEGRSQDGDYNDEQKDDVNEGNDDLSEEHSKFHDKPNVYPQDDVEEVYCVVVPDGDDEKDNRNDDTPPVESEEDDEPDAADSVDDRLEEFKNLDVDDFEDPSTSGDLDVPDDATKDFDTNPGFGLGEDLDKKIGPNPAEGFDQRFENRPGGGVEQDADHEQNGEGDDLPQKDFKTEGDEPDWDAEIGPNPAEGFDQRFDNRPGDDAEQDVNKDRNDADDENLPQKDFRTSDDEMEWDTEIGPNPTDGFDQRFDNRPGDDVEQEENAGHDQNDCDSDDDGVGDHEDSALNDPSDDTDEDAEEVCASCGSDKGNDISYSVSEDRYESRSGSQDSRDGRVRDSRGAWSDGGDRTRAGGHGRNRARSR